MFRFRAHFAHFSSGEVMAFQGEASPPRVITTRYETPLGICWAVLKRDGAPLGVGRDGEAIFLFWKVLEVEVRGRLWVRGSNGVWGVGGREHGVGRSGVRAGGLGTLGSLS